MQVPGPDDSDATKQYKYVTAGGLQALCDEMGIAIDIGQKWEGQDANVEKVQCRLQSLWSHVPLQVVYMPYEKHYLAAWKYHNHQ